MRHSLRNLYRSTILCPLVSAAVSIANAQCVDWTPGFGVPGWGANYTVDAFTVFDDGSGPALYAAGTFDSIGGVSTSVAKWNGSGWSAIGPAFNAGINAFATFDDGTGPALYIGGSFTVLGGAPANNLARWNGAQWTAVGGGTSGSILAMTAYDDGSGPALYVAGTFSMAGGMPANRIARWNGSSWSTLSTGFNFNVAALVAHDDGHGAALYAGGFFTTAGGVSAVHIARWNGTSWSAVGQGLAGTGSGVYCLMSDGYLFAGGRFDLTGGNNVAAWNGFAWAPVGGGTSEQVSALAHFDDGISDVVFAGGAFETAGSHVASHVAIWDWSSWSPMSSGTDAAPSAIAALDTGAGLRVFVGGGFQVAGGKSSKHIGSWGIPCYAPIITEQPVSTTAVLEQNIVFHVTAHGTAPMTYRWRKDGVELTDLGPVTGSHSDTVTLHYFAFADGGSYDCVVSNALGTLISDAAILIIPVGNSSGVPYGITPVVAPPEAVPNSPGDTYTWAVSPAQAVTGEVMFFARLNETTPYDGIDTLNLWQDGVDQIVYRVGDPAPGAPVGATFTQFETYQVRAGGSLLFFAHLQGPGINASNSTGIWYRDASGVNLVARKGSQAAGLSPGMTLGSVDNFPTLGNSGEVVFRADAYIGATYAWTGIWRWKRDTGQELVARTGAQAPGTSDSFTSFGQPRLSPMDEVVLVGSTTGGGGLWSGLPGALQPLLKTGDVAPGSPPGTTFSWISDSLVIDKGGDIALQTRVIGTDNIDRFAVFRFQQGALVPIVVGGQPAPGADATATFFNPDVNGINDHAVLVRSGVSTGCQPPCVTSGLWLADSTDAPRLVASNHTVFPEIPSTWGFGEFDLATLNDSDQVVFQTLHELSPSVHAVFGWTPIVGVFPIAVPGMQLQVSPGDIRTVWNAGLSEVTGGSSGPNTSTGLLDSGRVILPIGFTNFSGGIFRGQFVDFQSRYFAPGVPICAGDGSSIPCPCTSPGLVGHGCDNSAATGGAQLSSSGGASLAEDSVVLLSQGELPSALSIFLQGKQLITPVAFGDGVRCIGGSLKRIAVKNAQLGSVSYPVAGDSSISFRSAQLGDPILASTSRYYQTYYRDPALGFCPAPTGNSWNVSSGQSVLWYP